MTAPQEPRRRRRRRRALVAAAAVLVLFGMTLMLLALRARRYQPGDPVPPGHGDRGLEAMIVRNARSLGTAGEPLIRMTSCAGCHSGNP